MSDTVSIGDNERRAVIAFGFDECLNRLVRVGAVSNFGDIDIAVCHRDRAEVLLCHVLSGGGELGDGGSGCRLGHLPAGVGIHFRIHHEDVDVGSACQHVVQASVADIIRPAVPADDPNAFLDKIIGNAEQSFAFVAVALCALGLELIDEAALGLDAVLRALCRHAGDDPVAKPLMDTAGGDNLIEEFEPIAAELVDG